MKKLALITSAVVALSAGAYYIRILGSEIALFEMFPDHDPKLVVKAHRQFVKDTLAGKYEGVDLNDDQCTEIMKDYLNRLTY